MISTAKPDVTLTRVLIPIDDNVVPVGYGTLMVGTYLKSKGFKVDYRDYACWLRAAGPGKQPPANSQDIESLVDFLDTDAPVLGVGCLCDVLPFVIAACQRIKEKRKDIRIVLGGPGAFMVEEEVLRAFPWIDFIVRGEGEITMEELLGVLTGGGSPSRVRGLFYREGEDIAWTGPREPIADLDTLPQADFSMLPTQSLAPIEREDGPGSYGLFHIVTSRGCLVNCKFCASPGLWPRLRMHSAQWVTQQIGMALDVQKTLVGPTDGFSVVFCDDTFTSARRRALKILDMVHDDYGEFQSCANSRVNFISEGFLRNLRERGMMKLGMGIETGSQQVLERIKNGFTVEQAERAIGLCTRYMKGLRLWFMWGFPFETLKDFFETVFFINRLAKAYPGAHIETVMSPLAPVPGSKFWEGAGTQMRPSWTMPVHTIVPKELTERNPQVRRLVESYPLAFPSFFVVDSPHLSMKADFIQRIWDTSLPASA